MFWHKKVPLKESFALPGSETTATSTSRIKPQEALDAGKNLPQVAKNASESIQSPSATGSHDESVPSLETVKASISKTEVSNTPASVAEVPEKAAKAMPTVGKSGAISQVKLDRPTVATPVSEASAASEKSSVKSTNSSEEKSGLNSTKEPESFDPRKNQKVPLMKLSLDKISSSKPLAKKNEFMSSSPEAQGSKDVASSNDMPFKTQQQQAKVGASLEMREETARKVIPPVAEKSTSVNATKNSEKQATRQDGKPTAQGHHNSEERSSLVPSLEGSHHTESAPAHPSAKIPEPRALSPCDPPLADSLNRHEQPNVDSKAATTTQPEGIENSGEQAPTASEKSVQTKADNPNKPLTILDLDKTKMLDQNSPRGTRAVSHHAEVRTVAADESLSSSLRIPMQRKNFNRIPSTDTNFIPFATPRATGNGSESIFTTQSMLMTPRDSAFTPRDSAFTPRESAFTPREPRDSPRKQQQPRSHVEVPPFFRSWILLLFVCMSYI